MIKLSDRYRKTVLFIISRLPMTTKKHKSWMLMGIMAHIANSEFSNRRETDYKIIKRIAYSLNDKKP